jgi:hypothetical protein
VKSQGIVRTSEPSRRKWVRDVGLIRPEGNRWRCDACHVRLLVAVPQERAGIPPGSKAADDSQAAPAEAPLACSKQDSKRMCGVSFRLLDRLLAIGKFVRSQKMQPETIISGAYTAMSAACATEATRPAEILVATVYLGVAMIYLIAPYQRKRDRPAR